MLRRASGSWALLSESRGRCRRTSARSGIASDARPRPKCVPSVSAYHLACGPDDALYVTGPTVSSFDSISRFDDDGRGSVFFRGLGRPQGLAFDRDGNLYVVASLRGRRGIVRISPDGNDARIVVAG